MRRIRLGLDTSCIALASILAALAMLASSSGTLVVPIGRLGAVEDGSSVTVIGTLSSFRSYESGSQTLLLVDLSTGASVKVVCTQGFSDMPGAYLSIGDTARATGRVSHTSTPSTLYCRSDDVALVSRSKDVLTVLDVCENWMIFIGDRFNVTGMVALEEALRLACAETDRSVLLVPSHDCPCPPAGSVVVADCSLFMDTERMEIFLLLHSFHTPR